MKKAKKLTSIILALLMIMSVFVVLPITTYAASHTQAEAVEWIKARANESWWEDVDGSYGCQCVDLVQKYYQYFGYSKLSGNAGDYVSGHLPSGSNWHYSNSPIAGSVFVRGYDNVYTYGHVGLVYAVDGNTMYTVETNVPYPYEGQRGVSNAKYYTHSISFATTFINPDFASSVAPTNPWISASSSSINVGESITFTFGADGATNYWIGIDRDGNRIITEESSSGKTYTFNEAGNYSAYITAYNYVGGVDSDRVSFTVGPPTKPWINVSQKSLLAGSSNTFTFGANYAMAYWIGIDRDGKRIITETASSGKSYTFNEAGNYTVYITASNYVDSVDSEKVSFTVWEAQNIGDKFTAAILNTSTGVAVTVDNDENVVVKKYRGTDDQLWIFERQGEYKNYKITNVKTGKCLDDKDFGTTDDTNILVWKDNGGDAQRWYIRQNGSGYSIVPKCAPHGCLDMWGGVSTDGNNIAMWTCAEGNGNQIFSIQLVDSPAFTDTYNSHKYELYNTSVSWREAYQFCEQQGGHLVTISSQEEQNFINNMISQSTNNRIWTGGLDVYTEGNWQWITGEPFDYSNWGIGEPNNADNEDYLMLSRGDGKWNDVNDVFNNTDNNYSFICEYDTIPTQATEPQTQATEPTDATQPTQPTQPTQATQATQATEPQTQVTEPQTQVTEPQTQVTEPQTQATEPTAATQPTQQTQATEPTQATQATEPTQATESTTPTQKPTEPEKKDITKWQVMGLANKTYTGKAITQKIIVTNGSEIATVNTTYTNNKNAGTATIVITGKDNYTGTIVKTFKINKAGNTVTAKASAKTVKYATVKKKAVTVSAITVSKAQGAVSYKKASGNAKITVNAKTGKLTVKKGTKKGTYSIKVNVTAKGNSNYNSASKTVTVKITVK